MKGSSGMKRPMPSQAQGKGMAKMPPGIQKRIDAGKSVPAGIARTRASLLQAPAAPATMKKGGKVKKMAVGGVALPAQAAARAGQALAARPAMPTQAAGRPAMPVQAAGARPFKKGGTADKSGRAMTKKGADARGRAMKGK